MPEDTQNWFDLAWLTKKTTFDAVKRRFGKSDYWAEFASQFKDGDEVWKFSTPEDAWMMDCGSQGFAIIRAGKFIAEFITALS
jgi:hypothetical protein